MDKDSVSNLMAQLAQEGDKKASSDEKAKDLAKDLVQSVQSGATTGDRILDMQIAETRHTDPQDFYALYQRLDQKVRECVGQFVLVLVWKKCEREHFGHYDRADEFQSKETLVQMRLAVIGSEGLVLERGANSWCNITTSDQAIWEEQVRPLPEIRLEPGPLRPISVGFLPSIPLAVIKQADEPLELPGPTRSLMELYSKHVELIIGDEAIAKRFDSSHPYRRLSYAHPILRRYQELGIKLGRTPPKFLCLDDALTKYQTKLQTSHSEAKQRLEQAWKLHEASVRPELQTIADSEAKAVSLGLTLKDS